jgi:hypothetical protein
LERLDGELEGVAGVGDEAEAGSDQPMITMPGLGTCCPSSA